MTVSSPTGRDGFSHLLRSPTYWRSSHVACARPRAQRLTVDWRRGSVERRSRGPELWERLNLRERVTSASSGTADAKYFDPDELIDYLVEQFNASQARRIAGTSSPLPKEFVASIPAPGT